ncbi:MAG: hypothetical protein HYY65_06030 [Candidatus Tectomicrobia bacterium]|uniref:Uncharacterized protein n=1 Tax=Tectimicrobiota bacterium TaxID=2528274 RepID=A0A932GNW3_UNCTE|nr:hypothetical protein [Candidatus Tectomicrobia bacterium]
MEEDRVALGFSDFTEIFKEMRPGHHAHEGEPAGFAEIQQVADNRETLLFGQKGEVVLRNVKADLHLRIPAGKLQELEVKVLAPLNEATNGKGLIHHGFLQGLNPSNKILTEIPRSCGGDPVS